MAEQLLIHGQYGTPSPRLNDMVRYPSRKKDELLTSLDDTLPCCYLGCLRMQFSFSKTLPATPLPHTPTHLHGVEQHVGRLLVHQVRQVVQEHCKAHRRV